MNTTVNANLMLDTGLRAQNAGQFEQALAAFQQVLSAEPGNLRALNSLGLLFSKLQRHDQAEEQLRRAISIAPDMLDGHVNLAFALHAAKKFAEAIAVCEQGLKRFPGNRYLQNNLATNLHSARRFDEAIALLQGMLEADPAYSGARYRLGRIYMDLEDCAKAAEYFLQVLQVNPNDSVCLSAAGECLLKTGRPEEALEKLDRVLALVSFDTRLTALKTLVLAELGRTDDERWLSDPQRLGQISHISEIGYSGEDMLALNRELSEFASNHPTMRRDPAENAAYKSWHSKNIAFDGNPAIEKLKQFLAYAYDKRLRTLSDEDPKHPFGRHVPQEFGLFLWAVRMQGGGQLTPHIHPDGWLSGVYYVDVPAVVNDPAAGQAGWLKLGPARKDFNLTRQPLMAAIKPEPGMVVTFPSYIWHDTVPLPDDITDQRLCLAFDIEPLKRRPGV